MNGHLPAWVPAIGCASLVASFCLLCLMPVLLVDVMQAALSRLHLSPAAASLAVLGILLGSLVNLPVYHIRREELQPVQMIGAFGLWAWTPRLVRMRRDTIIALNVGGCLVPVALAAWQMRYLFDVGGWPVTVLGLVTAANVAVCYFSSRPVNGVGVMMPGFVSPLTAVGLTWLLLGWPDHLELRAPIAFVAGVTGPLIGADLLHLRDITRVSVGMLSIGGAGTFDGIVLSGVMAALLA